MRRCKIDTGDDFFGGGEGIPRGLKPGLLRVCNDQGSRFISTQGRLAFDSPTVLVDAETAHVGTGSHISGKPGLSPAGRYNPNKNSQILADVQQEELA
jgi:hypothetical protein